MDNTDFAKRMKMYEKKQTEQRLDKNLPVIVRLDGRGFSNFTRNFKRPYDEDFRHVMTRTAEHVMKECDGCLAYTQSDEISIIVPKPDLFFDAKIQKLVSVLSATATSKFVIEAMKVWPEHVSKSVPHFDARVFNVPDYNEAVNSILWRQHDCVRNSVSMVGHHFLNKKQMHKRSREDVIEMLEDQCAVVWDEFPDDFKYGVYVYKRLENNVIPDHIWAKIPDGKKPQSREYTRHKIKCNAFKNLSFNEIKNLSLGSRLVDHD